MPLVPVSTVTWVADRPEFATRVSVAAARESTWSRPTSTDGRAPNPGVYGLSIDFT